MWAQRGKKKSKLIQQKLAVVKTARITDPVKNLEPQASFDFPLDQDMDNSSNSGLMKAYQKFAVQAESQHHPIYFSAQIQLCWCEKTDLRHHCAGHPIIYNSTIKRCEDTMPWFPHLCAAGHPNAVKPTADHYRAFRHRLEMMGRGGFDTAAWQRDVKAMLRAFDSGLPPVPRVSLEDSLTTALAFSADPENVDDQRLIVCLGRDRPMRIAGRSYADQAGQRAPVGQPRGPSTSDHHLPGVR